MRPTCEHIVARDARQINNIMFRVAGKMLG
jgi:hypothetical protein